MLEVNYCNKIKKRHFKIKLIIIKKNNFKTGNKCHVCDIWLKNVSFRDHWHIAGKYRGSSHKIVIGNW